MSMRFWGPVPVEVRTEAPFGLVDVTPALDAALAGSGLATGALHVFCPHTSCGLAVTELEEGHHEDLEAVLDELVPRGRAWAHDDLARRHQNLVPGERANGWSHVRQLLATQTALVLPVEDGRVALGRWQRVFLVELDGGRDRVLRAQGWGPDCGPGAPAG
jgi:secondary thiamine-phosphate synthase enzyme